MNRPPSHHRYLNLGIRITLLVLLPLVVAWGCDGGGGEGEAVAPAPTPEVWRLSQEPILEIGVLEGEEAYQLFRVGGAVRLGDGRIVVANTGTRQMRVFGADGRFTQSFGGEGEGPGEFQWPSRIRKLGGDTLMVWDSEIQRITLMNGEGSVLGVAPLRVSSTNLFPGDEWVTGRDWVDSPLAPEDREVVRRAVEALPPVDSVGTLRFVKVTDEGWIWVSPIRPPADTAITWAVYDLAGRQAATVETPPRFQPFEVGPDYVLGRHQDSMDVNYVRLYELEKPKGGPSPADFHPSVAFHPGGTGTAQAGGRTGPGEEVMSEMRATLRILATHEEIHYADHGSYTPELDALGITPRRDMPEGVDVSIPFAGTEGWMVTLTHRDSGAMCVMSYGYFTPMGWSPGAVICP